MNNNYVLITPVKNEEKTIGQVIDSVKNQSLKPSLWIIVNDGSIDKTEKILKEKTKNLKWIKVINKTINKKYNWLGIVKVLEEGYNFLIKQKNNYNSIGVLDSDITLERRYYEKLLLELKSNKILGVVSGEIFIKDNNHWIAEIKGKSPRGGARLYNKKIFEKSGGFPNTPSWDRVSEIKILNRGFKATKVIEAQAFQHRESFGKENKLKGYFNSGRGKYILNYGSLHTFLISTEMSYKKRPYFLSGISFFVGFLSGFLSQDKRIKDEEIKKYSRNFWKRILKC